MCVGGRGAKRALRAASGSLWSGAPDSCGFHCASLGLAAAESEVSAAWAPYPALPGETEQWAQPRSANISDGLFFSFLS